MTFVSILLAAAIMETIDSGLGMMYGTLLSPFLIALGYDPKIIVPSILLSQALGGFAASYQHHKKGNADLHYKSTDFKIAALIVILGIAATILGAYVGKIIPKNIMTAYIGFLVACMGILVLCRRSKPKWKFSWGKIIGLGILSSFNKSLSGGGFGPIVASGQVLADRPGKNSIGTTDFAEAPICIMGFITWVLLNKHVPDYYILIPMCIGAIIGGVIGPCALAKIPQDGIVVKIIGILATILGILTFAKFLAP